MTTTSSSGRQRTMIAVVAVTLLTLGAWLTIESESSGVQAWSAACLKTGVVMAVVWLAYPQVSRIPTWMLLAGLAAGAALLIFARQPRVLLMAAAITLLVMRLRSPGGKTPSPRR